MEDKKYSLEEFKQIIEMLRGENGCPWDKVQTHESLKPCMMEEAAEVLAAIRILDKTGNAENLKEELGDVLLQVMMHSQIAKEEGLFEWEDVVDDISQKMIRRHPHVFAQENIDADTPEKVLQNWEEIKKMEKEGKEWAKNPLQEIPLELPSLTRAVKVIKKLDKLYEPQPDALESAAMMKERTEQIFKLLSQEEKAVDAEELERSLTDILWQISVIAARYKIPLEQSLINKIEDTIDRY